ncbi:hypothetical protein PRI8871_00308 [Pseudoprimorskyibacter insulae]|uniref:Inner membrane protein YjgN n=2 Tax=Pseudoprimorskyibacter insulae TaxID=1695997 RepID=A0A2R8APD9_9RHOB|nr:hypothetical protein PRI8871_00308 [Pseudoprimorskyibacter insulae]
MLTLLTLGVYRFWMKTRLRRWYWSAIRPGGLPLEYVGDPFEKLLGFLIAVVILAFYIGIVNLLLMFLSFSLFNGNSSAYAVSVVGVIPLWFYAKYRARRYILARTRWRGLRFGLEPGAWGYAFRALMYWALTIGTAGLLWPLMAFRLEQYRTNRTFYGDSRMQQGGRWTGLYRSMVPLFIAAFIAAGALGAEINGHLTGSATLGTIAVLIALYGLVHLRLRSLTYLTNTKSIGGVRLFIAPSTPRVAWILFIGYLLVAICMLPLAGGIAVVVVLLVQSTSDIGTIAGLDLSMIGDVQHWMLVVLGTGLYFGAFLLWTSLSHAFVTLPLLRHYAQRLSIQDPGEIAQISQRPRDETTQAEGFAEALDVGASL